MSEQILWKKSRYLAGMLHLIMYVWETLIMELIVEDENKLEIETVTTTATKKWQKKTGLYLVCNDLLLFGLIVFDKLVCFYFSFTYNENKMKNWQKNGNHFNIRHFSWWCERNSSIRFISIRKSLKMSVHLLHYGAVLVIRTHRDSQ